MYLVLQPSTFRQTLLLMPMLLSGQTRIRIWSIKDLASSLQHMSTMRLETNPLMRYMARKPGVFRGFVPWRLSMILLENSTTTTRLLLHEAIGNRMMVDWGGTYWGYYTLSFLMYYYDFFISDRIRWISVEFQFQIRSLVTFSHIICRIGIDTRRDSAHSLGEDFRICNSEFDFKITTIAEKHIEVLIWMRI